MRRLFWPLAVVVVFACGVDLPDLPGLACDANHPCRAGRDCVDGRCFSPAELDAGSGGGAGGGGGSGGGAGGGGGSNVDAGHLLWSQWAEGFTTQAVCSGCFLEVDALRNNRVVSTIRSALDTQDYAAAINDSAPTLALTGDGRLRGRFQVPEALSLKANSSWLLLGPSTKPVVLLRFTAAGALECFSAAGTLGAQGLTQTVAWPGGFLPNRDYLLDVQWRRGQYRSLFIEGTLMDRAVLSDPLAPFEVPTELRLGINNYGGTADAGWTVALTDWQLGEGPETAMGP